MATTDEIIKKWTASRRAGNKLLAGSMDYILNARSKHIRSQLAFQLGSDLSADTESDAFEALIVSVELMHSASLIIDDLPAMDNADMRRGKKAHHMVFGEGSTILTAMDMVASAFETVSFSPALTQGLADALHDLCAGQYEDINGGETDTESVLRIHRRKTGALFAYAFQGVGILSGMGPGRLDLLCSAGEELGIVFQLMDDLLDKTVTAEEAGKDTGKDSGRYVHADDTVMLKSTVEAGFANIEKALEGAGLNGSALSDTVFMMKKDYYDRLQNS